MNLVELIIMSAGGIYSITLAIKDRKVKGSHVGTLYVIMASCAFIFAAGILVRMLFSPGLLLTRIILTFQGIDVGVWLGMVLAVRITGNFNQNNKETKTGQSEACKAADSSSLQP